MKRTVDTVAVVIMLEQDPAAPTRADFAGRDCAGVEEALGHIREALATYGHDRFQAAIIVPGHPVGEIATQWGPG